MPGCSGILRDCRFGLLLLLSSLIALCAYGGRIREAVATKSLISNSPRTWCEMGLVWESVGSYGPGVYGRTLDVTPINVVQPGCDAANSRLVSPRLAVFTFRPFDLNQIDADTLQIIKGVGPKLATAIVDFRFSHGEFRYFDELLAVKGIGPARLISLRRNLTLAPCQP